MISVDEIPAFIRNTDSLDREFSVPKSFLTKKRAFEEKRINFAGRWNENFLKMDMNAFRIRYDHANAKFFGRGKALAIVTSELQAYARFQIEIERIPVYLTDIAFYQQEEREYEQAATEISYEWKELLQKYKTDEICQQELKNAICVTLAEKGALDKETLVKETIRTMGYARSGNALVAAIDRGIKYGCRTGEIFMNDDKMFELNVSNRH